MKLQNKQWKRGLLTRGCMLLLSSVLFLSGCGRREEKPKENGENNSGEQMQQNGNQEQGNAGEGYRTGLAVGTSMYKSLDAGETDGTAQVDTLAVAVLLDEQGRIADCSLDMLEASMNFSGAGQVTTPLDQSFQTKKELGDAYGMRAASGIGKEWYEQAEAFERYVKGKTVKEIEGIRVTETTAPAEAELSSSVTIKIGDFVDVLAEAVGNAQIVGSGNGDRIGVGIETHMRNSRDAADGEDGTCQAYTYYAAVTANADGAITGCILDSAQTDVTFDEQGRITVEDLEADTPTKRELKDSYGLKQASSIGKEWYEQAGAFADYVYGKTLEEVKGIAVDENMRPMEGELQSSVTIAVGEFLHVIEKACERMKTEQV